MTTVPESRAARYRAEGLWDDRSLADGIEVAAARRPEALAVVDNLRQLTCRELARSVSDAVAALSARGVGPGRGVVLVAGNTVEAVVGYHALLRTGATIAILDRRCGPADVRAALGMLDALGARAGLDGTATILVPTGEAERLLVDLPAGEMLPLETFADGAPSGVEHAARSEPDRDRPAVVVLTSGTTSRPKGVIHSLNTLTAGARNMAVITGANEDMVAFLVSPLTSITGVMQMHLVADAHATLVLEDHFHPDVSLERINQLGATLLGGAPVIAERLLRAAEARTADGRTERPIAVRTLALGGAMLPRPLLELATDGYGIEIARVYGSSEAPNTSGSLPTDDRDRRLSDDGVLMPGTEVKVGSGYHPREGLLRGPAVFLGYVDPGDTEAAFEDGWFRTGDLVEVNDGRLTVLGRITEVVNRNGLKVSLAEIDAAMATMPGIVEHACFAMPDEATGERLAVAVLAENGVALRLDDVVAHLLALGTARRKLPEQVVHWDGPLPRTPSGKIVRSRLVMESPTKPAQYVERLRSGDDDNTN